MVEDLAAWITPFTFISGVGLVILSTVNRFHIVNVQIREFPTDCLDEARLRTLVKRSRYLHRCLTSLYVSISVFALAALISVGGFTVSTIAGLDGVPAETILHNLVYASSAFTTVGVAAMLYGASQLVFEGFLCFSTIKAYEKEALERIVKPEKKAKTKK